MKIKIKIVIEIYAMTSKTPFKNENKNIIINLDDNYKYNNNSFIKNIK